MNANQIRCKVVEGVREAVGRWNEGLGINRRWMNIVVDGGDAVW